MTTSAASAVDETPAPNPRREVVQFLADRFEPGESGFVRASDVVRATSLSGPAAGVWLARVAGACRDERYPVRPSPIFEMHRWRESNTRTVWRITRLETHRSVFPLLGGGEP